MIDDWMMIVRSHFSNSMWETFSFWNGPGGGGMRPLGSIFFAVTPPLFGAHPVPYILLNTTCWVVSIVIISRVVKDYCGEAAAYWFIAFGVVPTMASSTIFEPLVMIIGTASTLFWSCSLLYLHRYVQTGNLRYRILTYIFIIIGLLIYEVTAPLLLITALLPLLRPIAVHGWSWKALRRDVTRSFIPVTVIIVGLSLFQKFIVPLYGVNLSRLSARPIGEMLRSFGRWAFSVFIDAPVMIAASLGHYGGSLFGRVDWWLLVIIAVLVVILLRKTSVHLAVSARPATEQRFFILMIGVTLFGCSALSVFSGFNMRVEGIENRFLGSTWILLSILLGVLFSRFHQKLWAAVLATIVLVMTYFSFMIQANNYVDNSRLQAATINDCVAKLSDAHITTGAFVVGNVPIYATHNFNNEVVFAYRHDFGGQLRMRTDSKSLIEMGQVINVNREAPTNDTTRFFLSRNRDTILIGNLTGLMKKPMNDNVWWYEYDQHTANSRLLRMQDTVHFDSILTANRQGTVNIAALPVTERFRLRLKSLFKR